MTIEAQTLLPWSAESKLVKNHKTGTEHSVRTASATTEFWQAWSLDKPGLQAQGVEIFAAHTDGSTVIGWLTPPLAQTESIKP